MLKYDDYLSLKQDFDLVSRQAGHLERLAKALTEANTALGILQVISHEFKSAVGADAVSAHLIEGENFRLIYQINCTQEYVDKCELIPRRWIHWPDPDRSEHGIFMGTASQLKQTMPWLSELIEKAGRHTVGYAPLVVNQRTLGAIGFSFNSEPLFATNKNFISLLVQISAQGLDRTLLLENERKARQEAEAANKAKQVFLTNMNHEIRTPVGIIQGFADLLVKYPENEETTRKWATIIQRNTRQLNQLIGDVLDLSKIEANKIEIVRVTFCLRTLLHEIKFTIEEKAKGKPLAIGFEFLDIPQIVESDPIKIRQILINLLDNGVKFTEKGKVSLRVEAPSPGVLEFLVSDSGSGIPEHDRDRVFDPFFQVSPSLRPINGSGLGLSIARRLAEALGGEVLLRKTGVGGSQFMFRMKCKFVSQVAVEGTIPFPAVAENDLRKLPILAIDDSEDGRELIQYFLNKANASVEVAENARQGMCMALTKKFPIVLLDIQMPDMTGHEVVKQLRALGYSGAIMALTANALASEREQCFSEGFDDYMTKPIDFKLLISKIQCLAGVLDRHTP